VIPAVTLGCWLAVQQLGIAPFPAEVGSTVTITAERARQPLAGEAIAVRAPDGRQVKCGTTDARGVVTFVPDAPGQYVYEMTVGGVRVLAPHRVVPQRRTWLAAFVCVPLGLALLWQNLRRARGPRVP
jgi:hypothetical protein